MLIGALEAGGTKFKCAVAISSGEIMKSVVIKTTTIEETMQKVVNFFLPYHIEDLGVGCFGPISLDKKSKFYGQILDTPKEKWKYYDIYNYLKDKLNCNVYINTDVVTSAYGEYYFGFNSLYKNILYFTVGTGIGVGVIYNGNVLQGNHHTEMGHITINREKNDDYLSTCEFHDNCLEGLASGNSLDNRYNLTYEQLENREDILKQEAFYLAQGIYAYVLAFAPDKVIIGGGVSHQKKLIPYIREEFKKNNNGYFHYPLLDDINNFIVEPKLKDDSGLYGAIALAVKKL